MVTPWDYVDLFHSLDLTDMSIGLSGRAWITKYRKDVKGESGAVTMPSTHGVAQAQLNDAAAKSAVPMAQHTDPASVQCGEVLVSFNADAALKWVHIGRVQSWTYTPPKNGAKHGTAVTASANGVVTSPKRARINRDRGRDSYRKLHSRL